LNFGERLLDENGNEKEKIEIMKLCIDLLKKGVEFGDLEKIGEGSIKLEDSENEDISETASFLQIIIGRYLKKKGKEISKGSSLEKLNIKSIGELRKGYEKEKEEMKLKIEKEKEEIIYNKNKELLKKEEKLNNDKKEIEELKLKLEELENKLEYLNVQSLKYN